MHRALAMLLAALALLGPLLAPTSALAAPTRASTTRIPERLLVGQNRTIGNFHSGTAEAEGHPLFLQRDPSGYKDSVNLYAAFANNPVNNRDATGTTTGIKIIDDFVQGGLNQIAKTKGSNAIERYLIAFAAGGLKGFTLIGGKLKATFGDEDAEKYYEKDLEKWQAAIDANNPDVGEHVANLTASIAITPAASFGPACKTQPGAEVLFGKKPPLSTRLPQDVAVNPQPPPTRPLDRPVSQSPTQNAQVQADIATAKAQGGTDFRVNQQQVNANGERVGTCRPDLQYTDANNTRQYIEYDIPSSTRGPAHQERLLANDPNANVTLKVVP